MKNVLIFFLMTCGLFGYAQTQAEMSRDAYAVFQKSDTLLNDVYHTLLSEYKTDTIFLNNLRTSQRHWIKFRDAEMDLKFPNYPDKMYGSIHPVFRAFYLKDLTDQRIMTLKQWISGSPEFDEIALSSRIAYEIDPEYINKALVEKDSSISVFPSTNKEHRIFGYEKSHIYSKKLILVSVFTNEVKNNPFHCKYGAYYDTSGLKNMRLKYIGKKDDLLMVEISNNGIVQDTVYMLEKWFEFEN